MCMAIMLQYYRSLIVCCSLSVTDKQLFLLFPVYYCIGYDIKVYFIVSQYMCRHYCYLHTFMFIFMPKIA